MHPQLSPLLLPALNHLLAQEPWASRQLQTHAGKVACIMLSTLDLRLKVSAAGKLEPASPEVAANVTIRINPADLPFIMQDPQRAISYVKIEGDADLAQTISELGKQLRWDAEHDLSRLFGDVAGRQMAQTGKAALANVTSGVKKLQENLAEYFLEEQPLLVRPTRVAEFAQDVGRTRDDVERLLKRIEKLQKKLAEAS